MIVFNNCWQKSKQKTMSAESASLKIGYTTLKVRNLSAFHSNFKQTDFLRSIPPIFLTLTSQGGNQGMLTSCRELKVRPRRWIKNKSVFERFRFFALESPPSFSAIPYFTFSWTLIPLSEREQFFCSRQQPYNRSKQIWEHFRPY